MLRRPELSPALRRRVRRLQRPAWLGTLRRTRPLSDYWGRDRGTPIDRHYIDTFLREHRADIRGDVLEVMDDRYTRAFGTAVGHSDVLDVDPANPRATLVADLRRPDGLPAESFDCFVLTQTLQFLDDPAAALRQCERLLRPGGVLLATVPAISKIDRAAGVEGDYWRFTVAACRLLFGGAFGEDGAEVRSYGNVLTGIAFLAGMAAEELSPPELDYRDELFPVLVAARAVKRGAA